jgi:hypothetical protein
MIIHKIEPFLSEKNLYDALAFVFGEANVQSQVTFKKDSGCLDVSPNKSFRVDYVVDNHFVIEFNGPRHYTIARQIYRDLELADYCSRNGFKLVEIPYFIQLNPDTFKFYFGEDFPRSNQLSCDWSNGFVSKNIIMPYDFCALGLKRFLSELDLKMTPQMKDDVIKSLVNRKDKMFEHFLKDENIHF